MAKVVDLNALSIPELNHLKEQVDQEVSLLSSSTSQLKTIQQKLKASKNCLDSFSPENEGKPMLVPLTTSMYVPGSMKNSDRVVVDIGTGYYAEKTIPEANVFFQRRMDHVAQQLEKIQPAMADKQKLLEAVGMVLQMKMQAMVQERMKKEGVKP